MYGIIEINGGIGKNIMATAVIKNIKVQYPHLQLLVITAYPEVFLYNPDIYRVFKFGSCPYFYNDYVKSQECIFFCEEPYRSKHYLNQKNHLIQSWCETIQVPCVTGEMRVYVNAQEINRVQNNIKTSKPILVFQPFGGLGEQQYCWNRDIPVSQAQEIVNKLSEKYQVVQLYNNSHVKLNNCNNINWPLRDLFALLMLSDKVLGIDSFVQHFCAANRKQAVVCWITNNPIVFGYNLHKNIFPIQDQVVKSENIHIDSYFHEYDFTGSRDYDFSFTSPDLFNVDEIITAIN